MRNTLSNMMQAGCIGVDVWVPDQNGDKLKQRLVISATVKTVTHNLEPSQNGDNNESKTATNNIRLSVIANHIVGSYSVQSYKVQLG